MRERLGVHERALDFKRVNHTHQRPEVTHRRLARIESLVLISGKSFQEPIMVE